MNRIAVLAILYLCTFTAFAQAPGDTATFNFGIPKSYGAGYASFAIGANADFWKTVDERRRIFIGGRVGIDRQRKDYIDSGHTLRASVIARFGLPIGQNWAIRPFAGGGLTWGQHRNPQYVKGSYAPKLEAGISTRDNTFFAYGMVFLPDTSENKLRGWGMGFDYYWRLSPRISLHSGLVITRFKFYQPTGNYIGWYTGGGWTPTFGLTWHFKPNKGFVPPEFRKPIPNPPAPQPQPMIQRSQSYIGDFEKQFLKEKDNE